MQILSCKIFFFTLVCAIAVSNGQLQCVKRMDQYATQIRAKIAEATAIAVAEQEAKNAKQNIIGSALSGLVLFLKTFLVPALVGALLLAPFLLDAVGGALDGLANGGLIGILGGLARSATIGLRRGFGQAGEEFLKVSDPSQNKIVKGNIEDSLALGIKKLDAESAGCGDIDKNLYYIGEFVRLLLSYVKSFLPYLMTVLTSAVEGVIKGLAGGLLGGLKGLLDGLAIGSIKGFGLFLSNLLA